MILPLALFTTQCFEIRKIVLSKCRVKRSFLAFEAESSTFPPDYTAHSGVVCELIDRRSQSSFTSVFQVIPYKILL